MFDNYPDGSDLTIMNCVYRRPRKDETTGKYDKGSITIVAKDNTTGKKIVETIDNPKYRFYKAKDDVQINHNLFFIEKEKVDPVVVDYVNLEKSIAEITGNLDFYYDNIKNGNRGANRSLHTHPRIFNSDMNIEDFYRLEFSRRFKNNTCEIDKAYLDIEVNGRTMKGDFPEMGECPINAVTIICDKTQTVYTLLLREKNNPLIAEFENNLGKETFSELRNLIEYTVGGKNLMKKMKLNNLKFEMLFYDEEIELIVDIFRLINSVQPDFVLAWNMAFDIPYIIARIMTLGYDPREIMCHPLFKYKDVNYFVDERMANTYAERGDYATISSMSIFLDQMIQFASRRKGQSAFQSFGLDYIGGTVAKVNKLDYKHITTDIVELPYLNYKIFVFYNIIDTIVQKCIEVSVEDIDYIFSKVITNNTRYNKIHRQTVYLANRAVSEFYDGGYIMGNNVNKGNEKPEKFPGAFVADPEKISDKPKFRINEIPVDIYDNTDDFDYTRLYPSILQEFNLAPNTQIGKIEIDGPIHKLENRAKDERYHTSMGFIEDLTSKNYLEFCERWLKMAGYGDLYDDVIEYFTTVKDPRRPLRKISEDGLRILGRKLINNESRKLIHTVDIKHKQEFRPLITKYVPVNSSLNGEILNVYNSSK